MWAVGPGAPTIVVARLGGEVVGELPTRTVTFVFTDIEGSTRLLQRLGIDYDDVLHPHRRILRDAFSFCGGVEVDTHISPYSRRMPKAAALHPCREDPEVA